MIHRRLIIVTLLLVATGSLVGQTPQQEIQNILNDVNIDSLVLSVRELSGDTSAVINGTSQTIKSRHSEWSDNDLSQEYIAEQLAAYGLDVTVQNYSSITTGIGNVIIGNVEYSSSAHVPETDKLQLGRYLTRIGKKSRTEGESLEDQSTYIESVGKNVFGVQTGSTNPEQQVIVCAHYDCMPNDAVAPGADDNASGTAAVLEAARILTQREFPFSIVYALWDEEEQGLIGSRYYANTARDSGDVIVGVINLDMFSYDGNNDLRLDIHTQDFANSDQIATLMVDLNEEFQIGLDLLIKDPGTNRSDHASFWENGYGGILLLENWYELNPNYHTQFDLVGSLNLPYYEKGTKLALSTVAWLAMDVGYALSTHDLGQPKTHSLYQNYPNPFNPSTIISYDLPEQSDVTLTVYDLKGREIITLANDMHIAGMHTVEWNGIDGSGNPVSTGVYFARLHTGDFSKTIKMVYLK